MSMAAEAGAGFGFPRREEPGKLASGIAAVAVHLLFFAFLVFGVSWQHKEPEAVVVDLWNNLPPIPTVKAPEPAPAPKVEVKPPPPPPPPPEVKPQPRVEAKPEPKPAVKPDIALEKEKLEKARQLKEEQVKLEQKKREEQQRAETLKREQVEKERVAAIQADAAAKEAEKARLAREQQEAIRRMQEQQASAQNKLVDEYMARIQDKIKRRINKGPCAALGNPEIQLEVVLLPDGNVLADPKMRRSSGGGPCDDAIQRAVLLAQPLPLPPDPALFQKFRELNLKFRPNE